MVTRAEQVARAKMGRKERMKFYIGLINANLKAIDRMLRGCPICGLFPEELGGEPKGWFDEPCPICGKWSD